MNLLGMWWLFYKETLRFVKVWMQTIVAPLIMSLLYLLVFGNVFDQTMQTYQTVNYSQFLVPGLAMMGIMGNAYANPSSSMIQSKMNGNITFMQLAPLSFVEIFIAYLTSAVIRGLVVGIATIIVATLFVEVNIYSWAWLIIFALLSAIVLAIFGIISGILADKFEHISAFQNFIIMPLTFLSGVFYSLKSLPEFWQGISKFNPMLYMIDGFRFGFFGESDIAILTSLLVLLSFTVVSTVVGLLLLKSGFRIIN